ncbi:MAG: hypothetical protein KDD56_06005 [Bdellovibrionales bacterium]|nr:hypothetical protein [Bdellovibrionales bacterium]
MSLISIKNVVEPFSNKVHLVTIIVITFTFGIYRASGGTVEISNRQYELNNKRTTLFEEDSAEVATSKPKKTFSFSSKTKNDDDFVKSLLGSNAKSVEKSQQKEVPTSQSQDSGFDEIEKSLGLK